MRQNDSFKLVKRNNSAHEIIFQFVFISIIIISGIIIKESYEQFKLQNERLFDALDYCVEVYNNVINSSVDEVDKCLNQLNATKKSESKDQIIEGMGEVKKYIILRDEIDSYFIGDVLKSDTKLEDLEYFYNQFELLSEKFQILLIPRIEQMEAQYNKINLLINYVNSMYETDQKQTLKESLTREEYNQCVRAYEEVIQEDVKNEYLKYIERANQYLIEKERMEAERKRQEEIANAWTKLNVPYISQNLKYVFNGCEAASVLMGLQYKGYLLDMDIVTYSANMPKTNDPNTGFYLDIFGNEPYTEAHWIAPAPLVEYARVSSGNNNVIDATGWDLSQLGNEIVNNNPVVIYLTYDFLEPYNWSKGVPNNLHVVLVTGYNTITQQYVITDPYTRWSGTYEFLLFEQDIEYLYNKVGKRAVVIR